MNIFIDSLMQWRCRRDQLSDVREQHLKQTLRRQYDELGSLR
jgi:hypothetical protein